VTFGQTPKIELATWELQIEGGVQNPLRLAWNEFLGLPMVRRRGDLHCVSGWSRMDDEWEGVQPSTVIGMAAPNEDARYALLSAYGGHTTSLDMEALLDEEALLAFKFNGEDLTLEHGWPVRLLVPKRYGYKSIKWIRLISLSRSEELGYWEARGWSNRADPWLEDR